MTGKLHIFVSYARADGSEFAASLVAALEAAGFDPFLDRHDIVPGEPWEDRLSRLLQEADTLIYVITPASVRSERCSWEIGEAQKLSKRIIPVVAEEVPVDALPPGLQRLNLVFFTRDLSFGEALKQLSDALRTDLDWVREHTRISDLATQWRAQSSQEEWLLRGDQLSAAQAWLASWKAGAPETTDLQRAYIQASADAEALRNNAERQQLAAMAEAQAAREKALRSAARANRIALVVTALLLAGMAGLGVLAHTFWRSGLAAQEAADLAEIAAEEARANNEELANSVEAMREQMLAVLASNPDSLQLDRSALEGIFGIEPERPLEASIPEPETRGAEKSIDDVLSEEAPAPSAPVTLPPPPAEAPASRIALTGWNIDIFWCEGSGSLARRNQAEAIAALLEKEASGQAASGLGAGDLPIGRVRSRALSEATNARSGYNVRTNQIRAEAQESAEAARLKSLISGAADGAFTDVTSSTRTYQYLSVFICEGAKGAS